MSCLLLFKYLHSSSFLPPFSVIVHHNRSQIAALTLLFSFYICSNCCISVFTYWYGPFLSLILNSTLSKSCLSSFGFACFSLFGLGCLFSRCTCITFLTCHDASSMVDNFEDSVLLVLLKVAALCIADTGK